METITFQDRVAIVTGSAGGLGHEYAKLLASRGATVICSDLNPNVRKTVDEIVKSGGKAVPWILDITDQSAIQSGVKEFYDQFGRIDVLINNAVIQMHHRGTMIHGGFMQHTLEQDRAVIDVHLYGPVVLIKTVYPYMMKAKYGRILNVTSTASFGLQDWVLYGAAKGAQTSLAKGLAIEGAPYNIKINALAPLGITPNAQEAQKKDMDEISKLMQGCKPAYVAPLAVYLVSENVAVSGHCFSTGAGHIVEFVYGSQEVGQCPPEELTIEKAAEWISNPKRGAFELQADSATQLRDFFQHALR